MLLPYAAYIATKNKVKGPAIAMLANPAAQRAAPACADVLVSARIGQNGKT
jgi:hypothetical protein